MEMNRKGSHTIYDIKYHIVWIPKYRKPVMQGLVAERCRDLIRQVCKSNEVEIIKGHISRDQIHLFVSAPPTVSVSKLVQMLKGMSSRKILMEDKNLQKQYWGATSVGKGILCGKFRQHYR